MKTLYYLEFAQSIDENNQSIPAKKLKWFVPPQYKIAYEDPEFIFRIRVDSQKSMDKYIIRVVETNWFKNLCIRTNDILNGDWTIVKE